MITPILDTNIKTPLYEQLYTYIKKEIDSGNITGGEKLPSKRKLAAHINISQSTVENAYAQLMAEGYIESKPKSGYYASKLSSNEDRMNRPLSVLSVPRPIPTVIASAELALSTGSAWQSTPVIPAPEPESSNDYSSGLRVTPQDDILFDLSTDAVDTDHFPFSIWNKLLRGDIRDNGSALLKTMHPQGDYDLRLEIARYLKAFRGMDVAAEQVVLGAGMEYLLGLLTELLPESAFACEDPGYQKMPKLLSSRHRPSHAIPLDGEGLRIDSLQKSAVDVVLTTPARQFPLGITMSIGRRQKLLKWASEDEGRYLIEDDFDSEFRFMLRPIPTLCSLDRSASKVIYMNSFAKTLSPSLRIAYMVLPEALLKRYAQTMSFYSCTVSEFEQRIICAFLKGGYYERHLNRMRNVYRKRRDSFIEALQALDGKLAITGQEAGLHLLLKMKDKTEAELTSSAQKKGVQVYPLSDYYWKNSIESNTVIAGYAGYRSEELEKAAKLLVTAWR